MVNVLAWNAVDHGFEPQLGQTKDYKKFIFCFNAAFKKRVKTGWHGIKLCPSGETCLYMYYCFSELALENPSKSCWSSTKQFSSSSH